MEKGESGEKTVGGDANKHMNKVPSPGNTTAHLRCRISVKKGAGLLWAINHAAYGGERK